MEVGALRLEFVRGLYLGAEAEISLCRWLGLNVVVKRRRSKGYRAKELDRNIIAARTVHEASALSRARSVGVRTPFVLHVNPAEGVIIMEYVEGRTISECASELPLGELEPIFTLIGNSVALLHGNNIIHGDPTASNMILRGREVYIVDFGLASYASGIEQMGEDLYVFCMALRSAHHTRSARLFRSFVSGYERGLGGRSSAVLGRLEEISKRGRYVERIG